MEVQNTRSNAITVSPVCDFEVIEHVRNNVAIYSELGDKFRFVPVGADSNVLRIAPVNSRNYRVRLPKTQLGRDLAERGAATLKFTVRVYVKNQGLGLEVPYLLAGTPRNISPTSLSGWMTATPTRST